MGARWREWWRSYGVAMLTALGVVVLTVAQMRYADGTAQAGPPPVPASPFRSLWLILAVVGGLLATAAPAVDAARRRRRRTGEAEKVKAAREAQVLAINDALDPLVEKLAQLVMTPAVDQPAAASRLLVQALNSAANVIGLERTRVSYYEVDAAAAPVRLICKESVGRHSKPKTTFRQGTVDGDWVIGLLERNEHHFCPDVQACPPPGWDASRQRSYATFFSVPAAVGSEAIAMITVDAPKVGDLREQDVPLARVIGTVIAASLKIAERGASSS